MDGAELRAALADGLFETRYQPIVRMDTGAPIGLEVLARLNHPRLGTVLPEAFVSQIEDAGLGAELAERIAAAAFADMTGGAIAPLGLLMGLNLPLEVLLVPEALARLDSQRSAAGLCAGQVVIELTESQPVTDLVGLRRATERWREAGYRAVIDDVAPSLPLVSELMELPFSGLKLDKALVQALARSEPSHAFVIDILSAAEPRGLTITAEGVEDIATWRFVGQLGVHQAQGFLVAHPLVAEAVPKWMSHWQGPPTE
jgi:EAL domain-containing protein (putative c-di-GMP-specific phosphodiesterase class I)